MQPASSSIRNWLIVVAGMIFFMIVLGALTRLTESGLSMVEWKPVTGWLPPLSDQAWQAELQKYLSSPQGRLVNRDFDVADFKQIFWLEYLHRLWGRLIGVAFLLPFLWFLARGMIPRTLAPKLAGLFVLGGLQGAIGWFMVMSGLSDAPNVSHYRLALHLGAAILIYALMLRVALGLLDPLPLAGWRPEAAPLRRHARWALAAVAATIAWGAFVAGIRAGYAYNTFPDMAGHWIPPEIGTLTPWWLNAFENTAAVQLIHRVLALVTTAVVLALVGRVHMARLPGQARRVASLLGVMILAQVALGIATLLTVVWIPVAAAHQAGAILVVTLLVWLLHALRPVAYRAGTGAAARG